MAWQLPDSRLTRDSGEVIGFSSNHECQMNRRRYAALALLAGSLLGGACTAEVEDEGEVPEVNVEGGEAPKVDVDPANVDVSTGTDTQTVVTPDVDVSTTPAQKDQ